MVCHPSVYGAEPKLCWRISSVFLLSEEDNMSRKVLGLICVAAMAIVFSAQDASAGLLFNRGGNCCEPRQRCCREPRERCCREPRQRCCREPRERCCRERRERCCQPKTCCKPKTCCEPKRCCEPKPCCKKTRCEPKPCGCSGSHDDGAHDSPEPAPAPAVEDAPPPPAAA